MSKPISQAEYVKNERCPVCESDDFSGDAIEIDGGRAIQNIDCNTCGAYWTDIYRLHQYDNLHDAEGNELDIPEVSDEQGK